MPPFIDRRTTLPENNMFRYFQPEPMPLLPPGNNREEITLRTAFEIEQERLAAKRQDT